jgi:hypothetical protein
MKARTAFVGLRFTVELRPDPDGSVVKLLSIDNRLIASCAVKDGTEADLVLFLMRILEGEFA